MMSVFTQEQATDMILKEKYKEGLEYGLEQGLEQGLERGLEQGLEQGLERGKFEGLSSIVWFMNNKGFSVEDISNNTGLSKTEISQYLNNKS